MSQSVEPTGRSSPGEAATSCETVTGQTGPLEVPGMTPVGSQSVAHSEGEAPHLCWKTGSCSELCQYCYARPRERSSAALVPGHSWGGGVEVKDLVTFSVCPMSLSTPPEAQVAMVPGPLFENQSGGASASERAWGSRGPRGESGDLLVQALGDFSWPPVTEGARSLRPWSQRGQPSG